jgi:hypothetical protein
MLTCINTCAVCIVLSLGTGVVWSFGTPDLQYQRRAAMERTDSQRAIAFLGRWPYPEIGREKSTQPPSNSTETREMFAFAFANTDDTIPSAVDFRPMSAPNLGKRP